MNQDLIHRPAFILDWEFFPSLFSYEVKALSDLGIDLSKYDTSVQNGWIGLVKSVQVLIFSSVYVIQTVRVLGSYRPTTFIRNGSGDSWYPWELITTW